MKPDKSKQMLGIFDQLVTNLNTSPGWTVFLINKPELKDRHSIELSHLKQAAHCISESEYSQEILIERNLNGLCGYPVCNNEIVLATNNCEKVPKLNQKKIRLMYGKLNTTQQEPEPKFCSQECQDQSDYYLNTVLKKLSPSANNFLSNANGKRVNNKHIQNHCIKDHKETLLLEKLNLRCQQVEDSYDVNQQHAMSQAEISCSSSQQKQEFDEKFLEPILSQFESNLQLNAKNIDQNSNPIFSSIKIIEHPPKSTSLSTDALHSSNHLNELEHQVLNYRSTLQIAFSASTSNINSFPTIHELPSSLTQVLNSNMVISNSKPGTYVNPRMVNGAAQPISTSEPVNSNSSTLIESSLSDLGSSEAQIIYNVGSLEEKLAIDQAMDLRNQLDLSSFGPQSH